MATRDVENPRGVARHAHAHAREIFYCRIAAHYTYVLVVLDPADVPSRPWQIYKSARARYGSRALASTGDHTRSTGIEQKQHEFFVARTFDYIIVL